MKKILLVSALLTMGFILICSKSIALTIVGTLMLIGVSFVCQEKKKANGNK